MSDIELKRRAAQHYPHSTHYQAAWLRMVTLLGDKWLLAKRIERSAA